MGAILFGLTEDVKGVNSDDFQTSIAVAGGKSKERNPANVPRLYSPLSST